MSQAHAEVPRPADVFREVKSGGKYRPRIPTQGDVYGLLTIVQLHERINGHRIWQCACQCGAPQLRSTTELNAFARMGRIDACPSCAAGLAQHRRINRREMQLGAWRNLWETRHTLYGLRALATMSDDVREALESKIAPCRDEWEEAVPQIAEAAARAHAAHMQQRMATLYPLSTDNPDTPPDLRWECIHCHEIVERCFGCVECLETACVACVRKERHAHLESGHSYLTTVGESLAEFDDVHSQAKKSVSRERVRQIQQGAIYKIRRDPHFQDFAPDDAYLPTPYSIFLGGWFEGAEARAEAFLKWMRTSSEHTFRAIRIARGHAAADRIAKVMRHMRKFRLEPKTIVSLHAFRTFLEKSAASQVVIDASEDTWNAYRATVGLPPEHLLTKEDIREIRQINEARDQRREEEAEARRCERPEIASPRDRASVRIEQWRQRNGITAAMVDEPFETPGWACPCGSGLYFADCHGKYRDDDDSGGSGSPAAP